MRVILISLVLLFLIQSCYNDDDFPDKNMASVVKNGEQINMDVFEPRFENTNKNSFEFQLYVSDAQGIVRQNLTFQNVPFEIGTSKVNTLTPEENLKCSFHYFLSDGDVLGDPYVLDDSTGFINQIEIIEIENRHVKGHFQVAFLNTQTVELRNSEDSLRFSDGEFHIRLKNPN